VRADRLIILGEVHGEVQSASRIQICAGGKLYGDIETRGLVIDEGGYFEGKCRMSAAAAQGDGASPPLQPSV
jgi:cytoskeletal protein CcmA (bactofilin family)